MRTRFLFPALLIGLVACSSSPAETSPPSADAPPADADREAAMHMRMLGDPLAEAIVAAQPESFE